MTSQTPFLGILMLDTAFPRIPGDAGNINSYPFPAQIRCVTGAGSLDVVSASGPSDTLTEVFISAAQELKDEGAVGLVSTCGFLVHRQKEIASAVGIPTILSGLSLFPVLRLAMGQIPIAILTASADSLTTGTLQAADIPAEEVRVAGFDDCPAFSRAILTAKDTQPDQLDSATIEAFAVTKAQTLVAETPEIGCILLECGNLPPYANAIRVAVQRPVYSILDAAALIWAGSKSQ